MPDRPSKPCAACGRPFSYRKKWARNWESVRYCSDACRRDAGTATAAKLEAAIETLLDRGPASICPSEAARLVAPDDWRPLMEPARRAARRLANAGRVVITQAGKPVDPGDFKGPVRIARPR